MHWHVEEASVSIKCFDWSLMAAKVLPVASCEPAIHVLRSGVSASWRVTANQSLNGSRHCRQPNGKHYCNLVPAALIKNIKILVSYQWIGWKRWTEMVGELLIKGELHKRLDKKLVSLRKSWASKFSDAVWHGKNRLRSLSRKLTFSR